MKTHVKILSFLFLGFILLGFTTDDTLPKSWFKAGNNPNAFRVGIDSKNFQHGKTSAFIETVASQPIGFCTLMQTSIDPAYSNKRVKMSGYIKTEGKADTALMWVRIDDFDKRVMADFDNMRKRPITGTKEWTKYEIIFDVPAAKYTINYGLVLVGSGKAWIDNVKFEVVDKSTKKTANNSQVPLAPGQTLQGNSKAENLDFEN